MIELFKIILTWIDHISFLVAFFGFAWFLGKRGPVKFIDKTKFEHEKNIRYVSMQNKQYSNSTKSLIFKIDIFIITLMYRRDLVLYTAFVSLLVGCIAIYIENKL